MTELEQGYRNEAAAALVCINETMLRARGRELTAEEKQDIANRETDRAYCLRQAEIAAKG